MGDAGSMLLGLLMAMSVISFTGQVDPSALSRDHDDVLPALLPILLPFATMALPLSDLTLAWIRRTARGQHPFKADKQHLHHRLVARGHSQRGVVFIMCAWGGVIAGGLVCVVLLNHPATWWTLGVFVLLLLLATIVPVRRRSSAVGRG
jgi:undecaprenyl-phosphate alpha-N-acetylglucosaminyltransferase